MARHLISTSFCPLTFRKWRFFAIIQSDDLTHTDMARGLFPMGEVSRKPRVTGVGAGWAIQRA